MDFIPVPNCVQLEIIYNWNGQVVENVFHYVKASPWTTDAMEELAEQFRLEWRVGVRVHQSNTILGTGIKITDLSSSTAPTITTTSGFPEGGSVVTPSLPNNVACVFTKRTLLRGRSYRGRIYHPGLGESQVTGNTIEPATLALLIADYTLLLGIELPVTLDEALMCVVSRKNAGSWRTEGVATLVNNITSDGTVDSQRRRLPGRGQ